jgi:hypothetical protein
MSSSSVIRWYYDSKVSDDYLLYASKQIFIFAVFHGDEDIQPPAKTAIADIIERSVGFFFDSQKSFEDYSRAYGV